MYGVKNFSAIINPPQVSVQICGIYHEHADQGHTNPEIYEPVYFFLTGFLNNFGEFLFCERDSLCCREARKREK